MANSGEKSGTRPGMMGDGTEEQNLGQTGNPDARIGKDEVEAAFAPAGAGKPVDRGDVADQASHGMSDAKAKPEDTMPKDNSHNFT